MMTQNANANANINTADSESRKMKALVYLIESRHDDFNDEITFEDGSAEDAVESAGYAVLDAAEEDSSAEEVFLVSATKLHKNKIVANQISMGGTDICFNFDEAGWGEAFIFENDGQSDLPISGEVATIEEETARDLINEAETLADDAAAKMLREALDTALESN